MHICVPFFVCCVHIECFLPESICDCNPYSRSSLEANTSVINKTSRIDFSAECVYVNEPDTSDLLTHWEFNDTPYIEEKSITDASQWMDLGVHVFVF